MKIRIFIKDAKTDTQLIEEIAEISEKGDLAREVSIAVEDARKLGLQPFGWSLHVEDAT